MPSKNKHIKHIIKKEAQINPRIDLAFKKIFGVDENKDLLINSIVDEEDQAQTVTIKNPYNQNDFKGDKGSTLDRKVAGLSGKKHIIKMQISDEGDYDKRAPYNWGKVYIQQIGSGSGYRVCTK